MDIINVISLIIKNRTAEGLMNCSNEELEKLKKFLLETFAPNGNWHPINKYIVYDDQKVLIEWNIAFSIYCILNNKFINK